MVLMSKNAKKDIFTRSYVLQSATQIIKLGIK